MEGVFWHFFFRGRKRLNQAPHTMDAAEDQRPGGEDEGRTGGPGGEDEGRGSFFGAEGPT